MDIRLDNVRVTFKGPDGKDLPILWVPEFVVEEGHRVCLVGGSGSGKTTLLNTLAGIVRAVAGRVRIGDTELTSLSEAARDRFRAAHVGYVFQTFNLIQGLSARENVELPARFAGVSPGPARARADGLLERVSLTHRADARPGRLSVGEQQRVAIARALINSPAVVLADEPTANLDPVNGAAVLGLIQEVVEEAGASLILVTHEPSVWERFGDVRQLSEINRP